MENHTQTPEHPSIELASIELPVITPPDPANVLSQEERADLDECESVIREAQGLMLNAGRALKRISERRLYRGTHPTFEEYCSDVWGYTARRAYQLIGSADTVDLLESEGVAALPRVEAHTRPLARFSDRDKAAAWDAVLAACGGLDNVTKAAAERALQEWEAEREANAVEDGVTEDGATEDGAGSAGNAEPGPTPPFVPELGFSAIGAAGVERDGRDRVLLAVPAKVDPRAPADAKHLFVGTGSTSGAVGRPLIHRIRDELDGLGYRPTFNRTNDSVDWAMWTWNPLTGCRHGCPFCYARDIAGRFYEQGFTPTFHPGRLLAPAHTRIPDEIKDEPGARRVFVCSMGDLFLGNVDDVYIEEVLAVIAENPAWTFMLLTKHAVRLPEFEFPPNAWVGASVVDQRWVEPTEKAMAEVKASVRWVSCEPLRGPVEFSRPELLDLFVIGAQSKTKGEPAFQPEAEWVEGLRAQARSVGAAVYEKENLEARLKEMPEPDESRVGSSRPSTVREQDRAARRSVGDEVEKPTRTTA